MAPVIAVVGSVEPSRTYEPPLKDVESALPAAEQLGRELALKGCHLVVYSGELAFVEHAVVRGFVASGAAGPQSIQIWGAYASDANFAEVATHPHVFRAVPETTRQWEVNFYRSLLSADGVLLIGGGRSTFNAGIIALSRRIAIAPLTAFGGAAERIWHRLRPDATHVTDEDLAVLGQPWQAGSAKQVAASLVGQHERREAAVRQAVLDEANHRRRGAVAVLIAVALAVAALATIPLAYALPVGTWPSIAVLVTAPLLASVWGAITRNAYDGTGDWLRASALGCASGTIAFLLFVAAQLSTNPTLLDGDGARRLLFFLLAVGFVGGFTSQVIYRRLREHDVLDTSGLKPPGT